MISFEFYMDFIEDRAVNLSSLSLGQDFARKFSETYDEEMNSTYIRDRVNEIRYEPDDKKALKLIKILAAV